MIPSKDVTRAINFVRLQDYLRKLDRKEACLPSEQKSNVDHLRKEKERLDPSREQEEEQEVIEAFNDEAVTIVEELACSSPIYHNEQGYPCCVFCPEGDSSDSPVAHSTTCLWRKAVELKRKITRE